MRKTLFNIRGITLMEVMIGVVIVGIAASMAAPRFQRAIDRANFRSSNRSVISMLRTARSKAISEKTNFGIHFNDVSSIVTLFSEEGGDPLAFDGAGTDPIISVDTLKLQSGSYVDGIWTAELTSPSVIFSPNGSATSGGNVWTYSISDGFVGVAKIEILAATGRISTETYVW